jgi:hypothetical protein
MIFVGGPVSYKTTLCRELISSPFLQREEVGWRVLLHRSSYSRWKSHTGLLLQALDVLDAFVTCWTPLNPSSHRAVSGFFSFWYRKLSLTAARL